MVIGNKTGKTRLSLRTGFMRKPVLVIQLEFEATHYADYVSCGVECEPSTVWRDAQVSDLPVEFLQGVVS